VNSDHGAIPPVGFADEVRSLALPPECCTSRSRMSIATISFISTEQTRLSSVRIKSLLGVVMPSVMLCRRWRPHQAKAGRWPYAGPCQPLRSQCRRDGPIRVECMIKPWIFEFLYAPGTLGEEVAPQTATAAFEKGIALWQRMDSLPFEGIFFSEHHFGLSYSPSPNLLIAAIARCTRRLRLGTMGMVLPLYQPWRILEEIGMLDHLTGGDWGSAAPAACHRNSARSALRGKRTVNASTRRWRSLTPGSISR
jgi:Luciferase-like monooxygenase